MITLSGFGIGLIVGMGIGLHGLFQGFFRCRGPLMELTRPVPVFALIPFHVMVWHWVLPQILLVALGVSH